MIKYEDILVIVNFPLIILTFIYEDVLKGFGVNVQYTVIGFVGALLFISKNRQNSRYADFISVFSGAAVANYLTDTVLSVVHIEKAGYGIAFFLGYMGLRFFDIATDYLKKTVI